MSDDILGRIEDVLLTVWAAALDAQVMVRDEGATEAEYLAKQRHHIDRAKSALLELWRHHER